MHSNVSSTIVLISLPSVVMFILSFILVIARSKSSRPFFVLGSLFLILPILFLFGHISGEKIEMKKRAGVYVLVGKDAAYTCATNHTDSLQLTLSRNGVYTFNYKPCFSERITGNWRWTDNMVHSYGIFDKLNDSMEVSFPDEFITDTIRITNNGNEFMKFVKRKQG